MRSQLAPSSVERYTPVRAPASKSFGSVGDCVSARTVSCASPSTFHVRPPSSLRYTPPPPEYSAQVLAYKRLPSRGSTIICVTTSSWPDPIRLKSNQCPPSSLEVNTWPSAVPKNNLFRLWGSAASDTTLPPGGPTCLHVCAVIVLAQTVATTARHSKSRFICIAFSQSAGAPTSRKCTESRVAKVLTMRTEWGQAVSVLVLLRVDALFRAEPPSNLFSILGFYPVGAERAHTSGRVPEARFRDLGSFRGNRL